jgi:hypothetical protein
MNPSDPKETLRARRKLLATMVSGASAAALIGFNAPSAAASPAPETAAPEEFLAQARLRSY